MRRLPAGLYAMGEESAGLGTRGGAAGAGAAPRTSFNWGIKGGSGGVWGGGVGGGGRVDGWGGWQWGMQGRAPAAVGGEMLLRPVLPLAHVLQPSGPDLCTTPRDAFLPVVLPVFLLAADGRAAGLASSGALGMAAALDDDLDLKEQAKAAAMAERQAQRREAKEWLDEAVPKLAGK